MKLKSLLLILAIIVLPLTALTWAGVRLAREERRAVLLRFEDLLEQRLNDVNDGIERHFGQLERRLRNLTAMDEWSVDELRQITRTEPLLLQMFVLDSDGSLLYPNPAQQLNGNERGFLSRASRMFTEGDLFNAVQLSDSIDGNAFTPTTDPLYPSAVPEPGQRLDPAPQRGAPSKSPQQKQVLSAPPRFDWFVWYWDRGENLIYWQRRPSGQIVGAALERARWMADLVAVLPETSRATSSDSGRLQPTMRLLNSLGEVVYQWGRDEDADELGAVCEIPVTTPLASWRLQCPFDTASIVAGTGRSVLLNVVGGLVAAAAALCGLGLWLLREYSHDMRKASQQVSFVNQVSHELKTPLTNIRMYAELLDNDMELHPELTRSRERLAVITGEARRLSRLIGNVLTFARQERGRLQPAPHNVAVGALIDTIVDRFRPTLKEHGIESCVERIDSDSDANRQSSSSDSETIQIDPDFMEQILGNLISNVERYAAGGGKLVVRWRIDSSLLTVDVIDDGPGIPDARRDEVFQPFARLTNAIDQPAGTGIGLSIARDLARRHGGDLRIVATQRGGHFRLTLKGLSGDAASTE